MYRGGASHPCLMEKYNMKKEQIEKLIERRHKILNLKYSRSTPYITEDERAELEKIEKQIDAYFAPHYKKVISKLNNILEKIERDKQ